ncbi:MAG: hypothetical protein LCI00_16865 [Chloroflexi bacterium]|nr:hypothetical protein [Chloroflexota bacterium]
MANYAKGNIAEAVAICGVIDPDAYTAAAYTSSIVDMQDFREIAIIVLAGDLGASATLDCSVAGSAASNMSSSGALTGKSITQLTQAGTDSNKQAIIRVTAEEVAAQGYRYVQATMTVATATSDAGLLIIGFPAHYSDAADFDLAAVDEIVM